MIIDSLLNLIARNPKISKIGSRFADVIFPDLTKTYRVKIGPARNLKFKLNARTQTALLFGTYERTNIDLLLTRVSRETVFWDIGAHIGYFTCIMSRHLTNGCVVAVEPFPDNVKLLYEHIMLNDLRNVIVIEKALSSYEGEATFSIAHNSSMDKIVNNIECSESKTINVPVATIGALVNARLPAPHIIKVDAEGEEGHILEGARTVLQIHRPSCLIMIHTPEAAQICWDVLRSNRYNIRFLNTSTFLKKAEKPKDICGRHIWAEPIK